MEVATKEGSTSEDVFVGPVPGLGMALASCVVSVIRRLTLGPWLSFQHTTDTKAFVWYLDWSRVPGTKTWTRTSTYKIPINRIEKTGSNIRRYIPTTWGFKSKNKEHIGLHSILLLCAEVWSIDIRRQGETIWIGRAGLECWSSILHGILAGDSCCSPWHLS